MNLRKVWHIFPILIEYGLLIQNFDMIRTIYFLKYLLLFVIGLDYLRLHSKTLNNLFIYNKLIKPDEYNEISASTYYFISVYTNLYIGYLYPTFAIYYFIGLTSLAIGDPMAYLVGTRFPYIRLYNGKTLSGSIGCFMSCIAFNYTTIYVCHLYRNDMLEHYNTISAEQYFYIACIGAGVSSITELVSGKYDNLTIAPFTSLSMHLSSMYLLR
jgi:dolichol kinase